MRDDEPARDGPSIARVVVEVEPFHLDRLFDYAVGDADVRVGSRVEVVFAGRVRKGVVAALSDETEVASDRLRPLKRALGEHVWMTPEELAIARWVADRWGGSVADVVRHALPGRTVDVERRAAAAGWFPDAPRTPAPPAPAPGGWSRYGEAGELLVAAVEEGAGAFVWRPLADEDVAGRIAGLVRTCLAGDRDVLVVVPDPVSPVADAVVAAAGDLAVDARDLGASQRVTYRRWLEARTGRARVVVGGRGVALWPVVRPGLLVAFDEANPAHKERRSPRHHVREVVLERARRAGAVGLLVGTVASAATWRLLTRRRVTPVAAPRVEERSAAPLVHVDDHPNGRVGSPALRALRLATGEGRYGVLLATRRGEGRALACRRCGEALRCPTCASTIAADGAGVLCEGCGWTRPRRPPCPACDTSDPWVPLAAGAQRFRDELERSLPRVPVHALEGHAPDVPPPPAVLVVTRGSVLDAPPGDVGAVVLPDLDALLRRPVLDADEDTLRLSMALAGWVARSEHGRRGQAQPATRVVVQTREPQHPVVQALVRWDPSGYWRQAVPTRAELGFPPARRAVRVDAPTDSETEVDAALRAAVPGLLDVLGPVHDDGRARWLVKVDDPGLLLDALHDARTAWSKDSLDVRVDVDPTDVDR